MSETTERKARSRGAAAAGTPRAQDVTTAVLRTADQLRRSVAAALAPHGITSQQYNVLRILRGAHPHPLPTLEIAARMIEQTPGITRLLDRLEALKLARRERGVDDRRLVQCTITPAGLRLVAELDAPIDAANRRAVRSLDASQRRSLVRLLELVRDHA
ncbi:MAG TPA: MarR family transcriptional regulator [Gemmatimonadaceae bacterium]|nr:MarR family transcriptional regulator [Gemmatimonadaceae bacterium]